MKMELPFFSFLKTLSCLPGGERGVGSGAEESLFNAAGCMIEDHHPTSLLLLYLFRRTTNTTITFLPPPPARLFPTWSCFHFLFNNINYNN
jgi:hypothetical protein